MLARLKEDRIKVGTDGKDSRFGVIATKSKDGALAFIVYNYDETDDDLLIVDEISLDLMGLNSGKTLVVTETSLDRKHNNTYREWERRGRPEKSIGNDVTAIKTSGELNSTATFNIESDKSGKGKLNLELSRHSMKLIEIEVK